jgi:hypothetical protein
MSALVDAGPRSTRAERMAERIDWLSHHRTVVTVARIGKMFGMDPVAVLDDGGNEVVMHIRLAAYAVAVRDEEEQARRTKGKGK